MHQNKERACKVNTCGAIPVAAPASSPILQPVPEHEGSWFYNREVLENIPRLDWAQLYYHGGGTAAVAAAAEAG